MHVRRYAAHWASSEQRRRDARRRGSSARLATTLGEPRVDGWPLSKFSMHSPLSLSLSFSRPLFLFSLASDFSLFACGAAACWKSHVAYASQNLENFCSQKYRISKVFSVESTEYFQRESTEYSLCRKYSLFFRFFSLSFSLFFRFFSVENYVNFENLILNSRKYHPLNFTINKVNISVSVVISFHRFSLAISIFRSMLLSHPFYFLLSLSLSLSLSLFSFNFSLSKIT